MKACPICHARTFDDAEVCYGCMHRFATSTTPHSALAEEGNWEPDEAVSSRPTSRAQGHAYDLQEKVPFTRSSSPENPGQTFDLERVREVCRDASASTRKCEGKHAPEAAENRDGVASSQPARTSLVDVSARQDAVRPDDVRDHAANPASRPAVTHAEAAPLNRAGWVVRFELPGFSPQHAADSNNEQVFFLQEQRSAQDGGDVVPASSSLVVSVQPAQVYSAMPAHAKSGVRSAQHKPAAQPLRPYVEEPAAALLSGALEGARS